MSFLSFFKRPPKFEPTIRLDSKSVFNLLNRRLGHLYIDRPIIRLSDRGFTLPTLPQARSWTSHATQFYIPESGDCDDMAYIAKAEASKAAYGLPSSYCFGIVWTTSPDHALNIAILPTCEIIFLDPSIGTPVSLKGQITLILI